LPKQLRLCTYAHSTDARSACVSASLEASAGGDLPPAAASSRARAVSKHVNAASSVGLCRTTAKESKNR